jgi:peptidoglycan/LPS O-acetylase OafA/YrhL
MTRSRLEHVDMLRGLAATLVLGSHLRTYVFADFGALDRPGLLARGFYAATSLGHAAVILFFAMSGFLIGGKALPALLAGEFAWPPYLLRRATRLLIVAVPALALTALLDHLGGVAEPGAAVQPYASWPMRDAAPDYSWTTLAGNLAFLQTIAVPVFGSNSPSWSLANEWWYYLIVPLAGVALLPRQAARARGFALVLLAAAAVLLPWRLLLAGAIWAAGAVAAWLGQRERSAPLLRHRAVRGAALAAAAAGLAATRAWPYTIGGDLALGLAVAVGLPVTVLLPSFGAAYRRLARAGAEISYTLYLTHFPFLTCLVMVGFAPHRFSPGAAGALVYAGLFAAALAWAAGAWWCCERHTDRLYRRLAAWLPARRGAAALPAAARP